MVVMWGPRVELPDLSRAAICDEDPRQLPVEIRLAQYGLLVEVHK
jgi:hypothetical protein